MGTPISHAYPAGIAPTPRTAPKQCAATHPQGSRLFPPPGSKHSVAAATPFQRADEVIASSSRQPQNHQPPPHSSLTAESFLCTDAETVSACKQLDEAAARLALHSPDQQPAWQAQADTKPPLQSSVTDPPEIDAELTSACQQLAEAAAGHAHHRASLQQALTQLSSQQAPSWGAAADAVAAAGLEADQHEQNSCSTACAALLQAAEASCAEDVDGTQAEYADDPGSNNTEDLALACAQLTEQLSAHASQQDQLQQLLQQQQLAATPSKALFPAVTAQQVQIQAARQHQAAKLAFDKAGKAGARVRQHCSAIDTAAWPPGPPNQPHKGHLMQAAAAGRSAKGLNSKARQFQNAIFTDACRSANQGPLSERASVQANLTTAYQTADVAGVDYAGSPAPLPHSALVHELEAIMPQVHGLTTIVPVPDHAEGTVRDAMKDLESNASAPNALHSADPGSYLVAAAHKVEPSFGAVHAMLSALQLPSMVAASAWEEDTLAHTCLLQQPAFRASEGNPEYTSCRSYLKCTHAALHAELSWKQLPMKRKVYIVRHHHGSFRT